jgi:SAM-dependent methyltransferase
VSSSGSDDVRRTFPLALDLGCHGDEIATALGARSPLAPWCARTSAWASRRMAQGPAVVADEEALPFAPRSFDLVLSAMSLHWVNDLPGTLIQIGRVLKPDGSVLAACWAADLVAAAPGARRRRKRDRGRPQPARLAVRRPARCGGLLQRAGFALPVADSETIDVDYQSARADARPGAMGESNLVAERRRGFSRRSHPHARRRDLRRALRAAIRRVAATFEVLFLHGWAPHPSQPKPLSRAAPRIGWPRRSAPPSSAPARRRAARMRSHRRRNPVRELRLLLRPARPVSSTS